MAQNVTIGALAAFGLVKGTLIPASANTYRVVSTDLAYQIVDLGSAIDDGQEVGLAHGDYTATEIEACLESQAAIDIGDLVLQEVANRKVRSIGFASGTGNVDTSLVIADGKPVKTKLNWLVGIGDTIDAWIRNGSDTVWTTGATLAIVGHIWVRD